jgi:ubiquinone/menaquinone biosynthesis C-methylase UbiE
MDSSREMLKMAEQKIEQDDHLKFKTLFFDLENDNYAGDPFDIIYSQMVLHHIKDTDAIIKKFYDLLMPGGILAIADLYLEDGSFHEGDTNVYFGFNPEKLVEILRLQGFHGPVVSPCFIIRKEVAAGKMKEYPVFLLTSIKQ